MTSLDKTVEIDFRSSPIQCTYNYARFKHRRENRLIHENHLKQLIIAMKHRNMLEAFPILVDENDVIWDGHHRHLAAQELKVPLFYRVIKGLKLQDIIDANSNTNKWSLADHLHTYVTQGNPSYVKLKHIADTHTNLSVAVLIRIFGGSPEAVTAFKKGEFKLDDESEVLSILAQADKIVGFLLEKMINDRSILKTQTFISGLCIFLKYNNVDVDHFLYKLEKSIEKIHGCTHMNHYAELLKRIYNKGTRKEKRV